MSLPRTLLILSTLILLAAAAFIYSGLFDPAADTRHSRPVYWVLETLRHRGIEARVKDVRPPDLAEPALVTAGAGNYDAMCTGCHLKPGVADSELHRGLYPTPPALATMAQPTRPDHAFWIIKHGIKASGMPAWGQSMDDQAIWGMVAFLQQLPRFTPEKYRLMVESSAGHSHAAADPTAVMDMEPDHHATPTNTGSPAPATGSGQHDDGHDHQHGDGA